MRILSVIALSVGLCGGLLAPPPAIAKEPGHAAAKGAAKMAYECPKCPMKAMKAGDCPHCKVAMVQGKSASAKFECPKCPMKGMKAGKCPHCKVGMKAMKKAKSG
jgi:hypothetical protein